MKKTVEDAINLIVENAAVVQSAMCDPQLSAMCQMGVGKLASEIEELTLRIWNCNTWFFSSFDTAGKLIHSVLNGSTVNLHPKGGPS